MTREHISCILKLRLVLLSFQTGSSLFNAAVVCAVLESISGFEPSSDRTEPRYLKRVNVSSACPFTLIFLLMLLVLFVIGLVFSALSPRCGLWGLCPDAQLILPVLRPFLLSHQYQQKKPRLVNVVPPMLTVPSWSSKTSVRILSRTMFNRVGKSRHPCRTPTVV